MTPKQQLLADLAKQFHLRDFVETGTQAGNTFRAVQGYFDRAFTIELFGPSNELKSEFAGSDRAFLFSGGSGERLGEILQTHKIMRALFWLDAHGNQTFYKDDGQNQIPKELEAIAQYAPDSLVVVDDITFVEGKRWVNDSYVFEPEGWKAQYGKDGVNDIAVLHRGGYPENL